MGLSPRLHNVLSYSGAIYFFLTAYAANSNRIIWLLVYLAPTLWTAHFFRRAFESAVLFTYRYERVFFFFFFFFFFRFFLVFFFPLTNTASPRLPAFPPSLCSAASTPWLMTFLECLYYWTFAHLIGRDLGLADAGYRSTGPATRAALIGTAVFMVGEFGNFLAHVLLSGLRENDPPGVVRRRIPTGRMFALVSCPHYFFEIVSWVGFNIALPTTPGLAFLGLGGAILLKWGKERHDRYRVMFSGRDGKIKYPEERRAVIPYIF
jgi:hypothetical protein